MVCTLHANNINARHVTTRFWFLSKPHELFSSILYVIIRDQRSVQLSRLYSHLPSVYFHFTSLTIKENRFWFSPLLTSAAISPLPTIIIRPKFCDPPRVVFFCFQIVFSLTSLLFINFYFQIRIYCNFFWALVEFSGLLIIFSDSKFEISNWILFVFVMCATFWSL